MIVRSGADRFRVLKQLREVQQMSKIQCARQWIHCWVGVVRSFQQLKTEKSAELEMDNSPGDMLSVPSGFFTKVDPQSILKRNDHQP